MFRGNQSQLELIPKYSFMMQVLKQNQKEKIPIDRQNMHFFLIQVTKPLNELSLKLQNYSENKVSPTFPAFFNT